MHQVLTIATIAACALTSDVHTDRPIVGDAAPPIELRDLWQAPEDVNTDELSWDHLRGKVVVLEFWATWCGPCVAAIPHLNDVARAMADEPVVFIAMTDEDENPVREFLERREMRAWIGLDDNNRTFATYGIRGRPTTVIVNGEGRILAYTHPNHVSKEVLRKVLAGEDPGIRSRGVIDGPQMTAPDTDTDEIVPDPLLSIVIRPSRGADVEGQWITQPHHLVLPHASLRTAVASTLHDMDESRVLGAEEMTDERFYFEVRTTQHRRDLVESMLRKAIEQTFAVHLEPEEREVDVYVLRLAEDGEHKLVESRKAPMAVVSGNRTEMYHGRVANIATLARAMIGEPLTPVVDETGLTGGYDYVLEYDHSIQNLPRDQGVAEAVRIMREKYGLLLEPAVRTLEMMIVKPVDQ